MYTLSHLLKINYIFIKGIKLVGDSFTCILSYRIHFKLFKLLKIIIFKRVVNCLGKDLFSAFSMHDSLNKTLLFDDLNLFACFYYSGPPFFVSSLVF